MPQVGIEGKVTMLVPGPKGVDTIKKALSAGLESGKKEKSSVEIYALGSPRYKLCIISPDYSEAEDVLSEILGKVTKVIESNNGKVLTIDKWGKRRLAYEIQKKQYGFYVAFEFEAEGNLPLVLQNEYNLNDKILRYLTYRFTKNKIKAQKKEKEKKKVQVGV